MDRYNNLKNNTMKIIRTFTKATICFLAGTAMLSMPAIAQKTQKLSDAEIAAVVVVANQNDIDYAMIAEKKSKLADVLTFAKMMAKDHKSVNDQAVALVTKLGVTPKENEASKKMKTDGEKTKKMLDSKSGNAFNKAYIDNEVTYHTAVIKYIEATLIPDAQNKELKDLLKSALPIFKEHLQLAEIIQKKIEK